MKRKHKLKYIYFKKKGNAFGFQVVGYSLLDRVDMCIDLISSGLISVKGDMVIKDKDSDKNENEEDKL